MDGAAKVIAVVVGALLMVAFVLGLSFLFAYPTMWLVNYLFAPTFMTFVFGAAKLTVVKAWALNVVAGTLVKSSSTSSSSK